MTRHSVRSDNYRPISRILSDSYETCRALIAGNTTDRAEIDRLCGRGHPRHTLRSVRCSDRGIGDGGGREFASEVVD